jgi:hypothetical protein
MSKRIVTVVAAGVVVAGIGGSAVFLAAKPTEDTDRVSSRGQPVWTEGGWPFPTDESGGGWSFQWD